MTGVVGQKDGVSHQNKAKNAKTALTDVISQVLMVCGTLLAVANGFIPPFSAMIYGGLTDELMARAGNCTPSEALVPNEMRFIPKHNITNITETGTEAMKEKQIPKERGRKQPTAKQGPTPTTKPTTPIPIVIVGRVKELPKKPNAVKIEMIKEIEQETNKKSEKQTVAPTVKREEHKVSETSKKYDNGETVEMEANAREKQTSFNDEGVEVIETTEIPTRSVGTETRKSQIWPDSGNVEIEDFGNVNQKTVRRHTLNDGSEVETWKLGRDNRRSNTGVEYTETVDISLTSNLPGTVIKPTRKSDRQLSLDMSNIKKIVRRSLDGLFARSYPAKGTTARDNSSGSVKISAVWTLKQKPVTETPNENENEPLNELVRRSNSVSDSTSVDVGEAPVPKSNNAIAKTHNPRTQTVNETSANVTNTSATAAKVADMTTKHAVTNTYLISTTVTSMSARNDNVTGAAHFDVTNTNVTNTNVTNGKAISINATHTTIVTSVANVNITNISHSNITTRRNVSSTRHISMSNAASSKETHSDLTVGSTNVNISAMNATGVSSRNITICMTDEEVEEKMKKYAMYYLYAALATLFCAYGEVVCWSIATERGVKTMEVDLSENVLNKGPGFFDTQLHEGAVPSVGGLGDVNINADVGMLTADGADTLKDAGGLGAEVATVIQGVASCTSGFLVSFIQNWKVTLTMMVAVPVLGTVKAAVTKAEAFIRARKDEMTKNAKSMAKKSLSSMKTVVANAGQKVESKSFSDKLDATKSLNRIKSLVLGAEKGVMTLLCFGFLGFGFWYSSTLVPSGALSPGALMTIFMAIITGAMQMMGTGDQMDDVEDSGGSLTKLLGLPDEGSEDGFDKAVEQLDEVMGRLDVFNVYFHYPSRPEYQILKSVNIAVESGTTVALLGEKGCGKSALMKLLQRIYDPQRGKIKLDGRDIQNLHRCWFKQQIGVVHRRPEFFNTTIAENIAYGKHGCTLTELALAARTAGAHEFIIMLPEGYETVLSGDGYPLNTYQKQLLALSRALVRDPRILLFEEEDTSTDEETLRALLAHLDRARQGRTTFISTCHVIISSLADHVLVLRNGEVIEGGVPRELLQSPGVYRYLSILEHYEFQAMKKKKNLNTGVADVSFSTASVEENHKKKEETASEKKEGLRNKLVRLFSQAKQAVKDAKKGIEQTITNKKTKADQAVKEKKLEAKKHFEDKSQEGAAKWELIRMQMKDAPLLLGGAFGSAITGMMAPGISMLFSQIQKLFEDPRKLKDEGPFWASMFVVLGAFAAFGGTIEKFLLTLVNERLRMRLQAASFASVLDKSSIPQTSSLANLPSAASLGVEVPSNAGLPTKMTFTGDSRPGPPSQLAIEQADEIPSDQGLPSLCDSVPGVPIVLPGASLPSAPVVLPSDSLPGAPGVLPSDSLPGAPGVLPSDSLPSAPVVLPSDSLPGAPDVLPSDSLPGAPGVLPSDSLPGAPGVLPSDSLPGAPGVLPSDSLPGAPGVLSDDGLPGAPGVLPSDSLPGEGAPGVLHSDSLPGAPGAPGVLPGDAPPGAVGLAGGLDMSGTIPGAMAPLGDTQKQAEALTAQMQKDVEAMMKNSIAAYLGPRVQATITSVMTLSLALYNGWKMTLVVLAGMPIIAMATALQQGKTEADEPDEATQALGTAFKKIGTISSLGMENSYANQYRDAAMARYKKTLKKIVASGLAFAVGQAVVFLIYAGALRFGGYLVRTGDMQAIDVMSVLMTVLFGSMATSGSRAPSHHTDHESTEGSMERLTAKSPQLQEPDNTVTLEGATGHVSFQSVELADPLKRTGPLLSGMEVSVPAGRTLAVVGLDSLEHNPLELLLERYFDPSTGCVLIDGRNLRRVDLQSLRSQMAVVSPDSLLPHYTIAENIAYGDNTRHVTRQEIHDAAFSAAAQNCIASLPEGFDTPLEEVESILTQSQKQRIAIARALVRNPRIVIVDEIADTYAGQDLDDALAVLSRNRTCLVMARRCATVEAADQIVLLYRGRVLEQGTHDQLLEQRQLYYRLVGVGREAAEEL